MMEIYTLGNLKRYYCADSNEILDGINPNKLDYTPFKFRKLCYFRGRKYKFILFFSKNDFKVIIKREKRLDDGTVIYIRSFRSNLMDEQDSTPQSWDDLIPPAKRLITEFVIHYDSEIRHMLSLNLIKS